MSRNLKKAIILLSGGLDSSTILYYAKSKGFSPYCLIFDYGQRHRVELHRARGIAAEVGCPWRVVNICLPWGGSALLENKTPLPEQREIDSRKIPITYVPARNIIFLSFAASFAEAIGARAIFIGANALDYSGYPDCRANFFQAYQKALDRGLKTGVENKRIRIFTPLLHKTKAQIIKMGLKLNVPYVRTWSCYKGGRKPCGVCDSCLLRAKGFKDAGLRDPVLNRNRGKRGKR